VPVLLAIVNQGNKADKLVAVTSPAVSRVQLTGTTDIPHAGTVTLWVPTGARSDVISSG
jgi:copper(I)-binding protein